MNETQKKVVKVAVSLVVFLVQLGIFCPSSAAQRGEVSLNYSVLEYNPAKNLAGGRVLNGGGGSVGISFGDYLTLKGELEAYPSTTVTFRLPASANSPGGEFKTSGDLFSYLFGPQLNLFMNKKRAFGEALFGAAHTNAYSNLFKDAHVTGLSASNDGFAMAFGGGFDFAISKHVGIRAAQFDYFLTRYEWRPLGINNQSNFRYQAGMVFLF